MQFDVTWRKAGGKSANWLAWRAIVEYVNTAQGVALRDAFRRSLEAVAGGSIANALDRQILGALTHGSNQTQDEAFRCWADQHRTQLRETLVWLASQGKSVHLREFMLQPLAIEGHGLRVFLKPVVGTTRGTRKRVIFQPKLEACSSIVSPIYGFILDRLIEREDGVSDAIPIGLCERENCEKLMLLERQGRKKFCSDECRRLSFQQSSGSWNDYMREYRKKKRESSTGKETRGRTRDGSKRKKPEEAR